MRCTTYCTAASFEIPKLFQFLSAQYPTQIFRDVIHVEMKEGKNGPSDLFWFPYGVTVFWGMTEEEEMEALCLGKGFERDPRKKPEIDEFTYVYGNNMRIEEDEISLQNKDILTKVAISHGIAQSVKLITFEELIQGTIDGTKFLSKDLAEKGKIPLSRKEIAKKMGMLFLERSFITLHSEILDTPEFFWNYPELEIFYRKSVHYLDVSKRVEILNKKLAVIHELLEILTGELNHQHSSRLEWTIIILIVIEVCLVLLKDFFHAF